MKTVGKINGKYTVTGLGILVEHLTSAESMGTELTLSTKAKPFYNQAYILQIGPMVKKEEWGIEEGDRVLVQGNFTPVPRAKNDTNPRDLGILDPSGIKCVLKEDLIDLR